MNQIASMKIHFIPDSINNNNMKLSPLILALAMNAQAVEIPQTEKTQQAVRGFVDSNMAVCKKQEMPEDLCLENMEYKVQRIVAQINEICKDFPKEIIECSQYGLEFLMNQDTKANIRIMKSKDV